MGADTPKQVAAVPVDPADDDEAPVESSERDTVPPNFDLESFAKVRCAEPVKDESGTRSNGPRRTLIAELAERYADGDYEGALALAETVDADDDVFPLAVVCVQRCKASLEPILADRVGGLSHVPRVVLSGAVLRSAPIGHREGFVLALVDGKLRVDEIVDASGMPRFDALRILDELVERGVVA